MVTKEISPVENNFPLICFVHVPKCFGTSVITFLSQNSRRHIKHIELDSKFTINEFQPDDFSGLDWLSGHCNINIFMDLLKWVPREVKYFATVRNPIDHIASLVNYYFYQLNMGHKFDVNENTNIIGKELIAINKKSPESVAQHLLSFPDSYFNIQAKTILGQKYIKISSNQNLLNQYIAKYSFIANEHNLTDLYDSFGFETKPNNISENVNTEYEIDKKIFETKIVRSVINSYSWMDFRLYEHTKNFSFKPFGGSRKKSERLVEATPENFDEEKYLAANPDIKNALLEGFINSTEEHFSSFGIKEKRKQFE
jgi:hypothetical protein